MARELVVSGEEALKVAETLNGTTLKILQLLQNEHLNISTLAEKLDMSEAYISEQISALEELKLIDVNYSRGKKGIRKMCGLTVDEIRLVIKS